MKVITDYDYIYSVIHYHYIASGNDDYNYGYSTCYGVIDYYYTMPDSAYTSIWITVQFIIQVLYEQVASP